MFRAAPTAPPEGWDTPDPKTGEPPGIDRGWGYAPGANTDVSLRQFVQEKLITYPAAISKALSHDVTRWIVAETDVAAWVGRAIKEKDLVQDLWLGFVPDRVSRYAKSSVDGFVVLIPTMAVRHIEREHGNDGRTQRPPTPEDYVNAHDWLLSGSITPSDKKDSRGTHERLSVIYKDGKDEIHSIWEVRRGKKNRALSLISMWVKK